MTVPAPAYELFTRVQAAAEGTPYQVTGTATGFDVHLDIVDASWFGVLNKAGLQKAYTHHVSVPEPGVYTVTDESRSVEWVAGVPRFAGEVERIRGRVIEFGAQKVWAFDAQGNFGAQADFRFNSEEGRDLIKGVAEGQLQMSSRRGSTEKIGLYAGIVGGVGAVITVVVLIVMALLGKF